MLSTIIVREHSCLMYVSMMLFGVEAQTMDELIAVLDAAVLESVNLLKRLRQLLRFCLGKTSVL